jgi:hypothetical protein
MTISPDKKCLAVADTIVDGGTSILLIDLETGEIWRTLDLERIRATVLAVAFSPNNQLLACTEEGKIIIRNLHSRTRPWVLDLGGTAKELAFSVDGSQLRTNIGVMPLPASDSPSQPLSTVPADLIVIEEWVTWKMARILWIPHDYRSLSSSIFVPWPQSCFVAGNVVILVSTSDSSWIGFDLTKMPTGNVSVGHSAWTYLAESDEVPESNEASNPDEVSEPDEASESDGVSTASKSSN